MVTFLDVFVFLFSFVFSWVNCFLLHELMHIKSQELFMEGLIDVGKIGFTASPMKIFNEKLFYLSGGLFSGLVFLFMAFLFMFYDCVWFAISFSTVGSINVVYGFHEMKYHGENRFVVYFLTGFVVLMLWAAYVYFYVL